ncbi:MAG TPA: GNAT family N-acetyltransferase [Gaiellaceae bacterium]|jgi:GNAT superfamily N-acetyltransferase|nr:GNAT family N-acetyltransferase [Gaiellaceae bacterium]
MNVEPVDARTASDETLRTIVEIERACSHEDQPTLPVPSVDDRIAFHRHRPESDASCHWLAEGGFAAIYMHGPRATTLQLCVQPERRRSGIGTALLTAVLQVAPPLGVEALFAAHSTPAGAAFAARHGFADGQRVVRSLLDLQAAALPQPAPPDGFGLATWLGRVPEEHLAAYVRGRAAMDDAPDPEGMEFPSATAEQVRGWEEALARRGREMRVTAVLDAEGEVASFTEVRLTPGSALCTTEDTGTVAEHRGRGLARAAKLESLRRLRVDRPEVEVVSTENAEENVVMLGLNESLGFRRAVVLTMAALEFGRD